MNNHDILRAVSITSDPRLVPILMNLVQLRYTDGFVDTVFYSLGSALRSALLKCAEHDYNCVWESVLRLKEAMPYNIECVGFCSQVQLDLLQKHKERLIIIKPLSEIAEIIKTIA